MRDQKEEPGDPIGFPDKSKSRAGEVIITHNKENVSKLSNIFNLQIKWGQ